jgi:hypothetical protein
MWCGSAGYLGGVLVAVVALLLQHQLVHVDWLRFIADERHDFVVESLPAVQG